MKVDQTKFRELVIYLSARSLQDKKFGATKLNKLLYFCDFTAYVDTGKPLTGASYFRLGNGPAPKCMVPVRRELVHDGSIRLEHIRLASGKTQDRTVPLRAPRTGVFTGDELDRINKIVDKYWDHDADAVSDLSHKEIGWEVMRDHEVIPYALAFYSNPPLTEDEVRRGKELAGKRPARHAA